MNESDPGLRQRFLLGMSHAATTVNVVTTDGVAGRHGVTVSAMVSVSADTPQPPLLVCIHNKSAVAAALLENGVFCVNVLRDDQQHISEHFAGRSGVHGAAKFQCAEWTTQVTGAPRVMDSLVAFDCRVTASERVGSHFVVFGSVQDIFVAGGGAPLIYANRAYGDFINGAWREACPLKSLRFPWAATRCLRPMWCRPWWRASPSYIPRLP
jgi:flavin reductase (DIM6/NTAB) family NADH-FMN oxidoreductase RutF